MKYRAICFDFDYTLADATDSIVAGFQHALTAMGYPRPDRETVRHTVGYLLEDAYTLLTGDDTKPGRARFRELYLEVALPIQLKGIPLFPGAGQLLRGLRQAGVSTAIVSSRRIPAIQSTLEGEGLPSSSAASTSPAPSPTPRVCWRPWPGWAFPRRSSSTAGTRCWTQALPGTRAVPSAPSSTAPPRRRTSPPTPPSTSPPTFPIWSGG